MAVDDHVVDRGAVRQGQGRVLGLPVRQLRDVVGGDPLQEVLGPRPRDLELAHVRDVEQARGPAHREVLGDEARVLDGHVPATEGDHPGPALPVDGVEWRLAELGHRDGPPR